MKEKSNPLDLWGFMFIHIMAKELPYFKFEPNQWENGNIQMFSHEQKGVFIDLCSMYWSRLGELPYKLAVGKICNGNATALDSLYDENIFTIVDGFICIDFLNEQLAEFENVSKTNSENARIGWEKRRNKATAKRPQSDRNAIREDKSKEDKIKKENNIHSAELIEFSFDDFWSIYPNKTNKKKAKEKFDKLTKVEKEKIEQHLPFFISNPPFKDYTFPHAVTYLNQERFNDEIQLSTINLKSLKNEQLDNITTAIRANNPKA